MIDLHRRVTLRTLCACAVASLAALCARASHAARPAAFSARTAGEAVAALSGASTFRESSAIHIDLPDRAEDGAVVPLHVDIGHDGVRTVSILGDRNPVPLIARYELSSAVDPDLTMRIKLAESSTVLVLAEVDDQLLAARRHVEVAHGGCV